MENKKKNGIIPVIILAVVFGMASGGAGYLIARSYLLDYNIPFLSEINYSQGDYNGANLVIRDARKVIVEQDTKIIDTINSASNSIVGIFKKVEANEKIQGFSLDNYYQINQVDGQGLIITSDGWIITNFKIGFPENYVVITKDKKIYSIDKIVSDSLTSFYFLHINAMDLPVKRFAASNEINRGQLVATVSWDDLSWISRIADKEGEDKNLINSSDSFFDRLNLVDIPPEEFSNSVLFNLSGDIIGLINEQNKIEPIYHLDSAIISLLKYREIRRASLGVNYINLADLVKINLDESAQNNNDKGAVIIKDNQGVAIEKGSTAQLAGLKEGDIIISIDNIEINKDNDLVDVIQQYLAGDKINIVFARNSIEEKIDVILGEIK